MVYNYVQILVDITFLILCILGDGLWWITTISLCCRMVAAIFRVILILLFFANYICKCINLLAIVQNKALSTPSWLQKWNLTTLIFRLNMPVSYMSYSQKQFKQLASWQRSISPFIMSRCTNKLNYKLWLLYMKLIFERHTLIYVFSNLFIVVHECLLTDLRVLRWCTLTTLVQDLQVLEILFHQCLAMLNIISIFDESFRLKIISFRFSFFTKRSSIIIISFVFAFDVITNPLIKNRWQYNQLLHVVQLKRQLWIVMTIVTVLDNELLTKGFVNEWIVNDDLVVSRLEISCEYIVFVTWRLCSCLLVPNANRLIETVVRYGLVLVAFII